MSDVVLVQVYMRLELKNAVKNFSRKAGQTSSQFVREALRDKFASMRVQPHDDESMYGHSKREEIYQEETEIHKDREKKDAARKAAVEAAKPKAAPKEEVKTEKVKPGKKKKEPAEA